MNDGSPGVEAIRLENFMAFRDTDWLELRPVTLLFGRNSAGKSAIFRALRLLKQSMTTTPDEGCLRYTEGEGLDVGSYQEVVHGQDLGRHLTFGFRICLDEEWWRPVADAAPDAGWAAEPRFIFTLCFGSEADGRAVLSGLEIATDELVVLSVMRHAEREAKDPAGWALGSDVFTSEEDELPSVAWSFLIATTEGGFLPSLELTQDRVGRRKQFEGIQHLLRGLCHTLVSFLEGMTHLGPVRPLPSRLHLLSSTPRRRSGLHTFLATGREASALAKWMTTLDFASSVRSRSLGRVREQDVLFELTAREGVEGPHISLVDMGFGVGQVLPVVVECLYAQHGTTLAVEQPELHLHPRAQLDLGDLFLTCASRGVVSLIETHSEHLFLRLRRRMAERTAVAEGKSLAGQVAVYFIHRQDGSSRCTPLEIDERGGVVNAPREYLNFFSDDVDESLKLALATMPPKTAPFK